MKLSQEVTNEDDEGYTFISKYSNLLRTLCSNFEVMLLLGNGTTLAGGLFQMLIDCCNSKNLKISLESL